MCIPKECLTQYFLNNKVDSKELARVRILASLHGITETSSTHIQFQLFTSFHQHKWHTQDGKWENGQWTIGTKNLPAIYIPKATNSFIIFLKQLSKKWKTGKESTFTHKTSQHSQKLTITNKSYAKDAW